MTEDSQCSLKSTGKSDDLGSESIAVITTFAPKRLICTEMKQLRSKRHDGGKKRKNMPLATTAGPQLKEGRCVNSELRKKFLLL